MENVDLNARILNINFDNPITNEHSRLVISYPTIDYNEWKHNPKYSSDKDITDILDKYLLYMDCTKEYECGRPMMTTFPIYSIYASYYYYFIIKLVNQFTYNKYIDKLIKRHIDNIIFEHEHPYIAKVKKPQRKPKHNKPNKFFRQTTIDMFTGEKIYYYDNPKTGEHIESKDGNKLDELNMKTINKAIKKSTVPLSSMTFSFKTKK